MKIGLFSLFLLFLGLLNSSAADSGWAGNYTDKKFLNGTAVFQLNIVQEGNQISVDFDAVYNDGHGCAPQANGPAKVVDKNTLTFTFTDSSNNSGSGTIKRTADGAMISVKPIRVADARCVVFYRDNIRLKPAH
jgi:hypothetical protein